MTDSPNPNEEKGKIDPGGDGAKPAPPGSESPPAAPAAALRGTGRTGRAGIALFVAALAAIVIGLAAVWAAYPLWAPKIAAAIKDPRVLALAERVQRLEEQAKAQPPSADVLKDLEAERARFTQQLAETMKRLQGLEQSVAAVRQMATAAAGPREAAEARASLQELSERLAALEKSGGTLQQLSNRVSELEKTDSAKEQNVAAGNRALATAIDDIAKRVGALEKAEVKATRAGSDARAIVLAVAQLREVLRGAGPFAKELEALKAIGGGHPDVLKATAALQPFAAKGVPTIADLRTRFETTATRIARAAGDVKGEGWFERTVSRLSTLVTVRRLDGRGGDGSPDTALAEAERHLKDGDLIGCVQALERLTGAAAEAAAPWLQEARARIAVEGALAALHVHAISLLAPAKE